MDFSAPATEEIIVRAVEKGGYGARPAGAEKKEAAKPDDGAGSKKVLRTLIISAILLVPLMYIMLGGPLPAPLKKPMLSGLVQLFLAAPVIWLGRDYYISGYKALFHRVPNMSSLIAVGSSAGLATDG